MAPPPSGPGSGGGDADDVGQTPFRPLTSVPGAQTPRGAAPRRDVAVARPREPRPSPGPGSAARGAPAGPAPSHRYGRPPAIPSPRAVRPRSVPGRAGHIAPGER